jgi:hypothetical protein
MTLHFEVSSFELVGSMKALYILPHDRAHIETLKSNALLKPVLKVFFMAIDAMLLRVSVLALAHS